MAVVEIKDRPIGTNHCPIHRYNGSAVLLARTLRYSHVHHGRHLELMRPKTAPPQHLVAPLKLLIVLSHHCCLIILIPRRVVRGRTWWSQLVTLELVALERLWVSDVIASVGYLPDQRKVTYV